MRPLDAAPAVLEVRDLRVRFSGPSGTVHAVQQLDFRLERGRTLGIVGESGSGKTQAMLAVMGLLTSNGSATGQVLHHGRDLLRLRPKALAALRGQRIAMVFQDPMTALNPYLTVERQMTEVLQVHRGMSRRAARAEALRALDAVQIPDAARRIDLHPHEFSGGMRQRVLIAMALLCEPEVLIADEPTTALDVTVQAQILHLLLELQRSRGTAIVLITHDLGVVAGVCDEVLVMYGGRVLEHAPVEALFDRPSHPYTRALLAAVPRLDVPRGVLDGIPGDPPDLRALPPGCPFSPRCTAALPVCGETPPALQPVVPGSPHWRACHRAPADIGVVGTDHG